MNKNSVIFLENFLSCLPHWYKEYVERKVPKYGQKIGKERGNCYRKHEEISGRKAHTKNTEAWLKCFDNHRCLSQSEESKCIWTCGSIFTMCSRTFTLLWLRKTSVIVEMFQLSFCVFCVPFVQRSLHIFGKNFLFLFLFFCVIKNSSFKLPLFSTTTSLVSF